MAQWQRRDHRARWTHGDLHFGNEASACCRGSAGPQRAKGMYTDSFSLPYRPISADFASVP